MKKVMTVIVCSLLLSSPVLSFAEREAEPYLSLSAYQRADFNAKFIRDGEVFKNRKNKAIRASEARRLAKKEETEEIKKEEVAQDNGMGQFKLKF